MLTQKDIRCWYELSWRAREKAIILGIHKDVLNHIQAIPKNGPIVQALMEEFQFADFSGELKVGADFGFDRVFKAQKSRGDFLEFRIKLPRIKKQTDQPCSQCNGTGKDELDPLEKCLGCGGAGYEKEYDWKKAYAISASFTVLLIILNVMTLQFPEKETSCPQPQLMTIQTSTQPGQHGGSLHGEYGVSLCGWLSSLGRNTIVLEMVEAMKIAYGRMLDWDGFYTDSFRARVDYENGWLNVSCPGDACGLHPSHGSVTKDQGYEFSCHNVDSPTQQLTLLAGLAALHDKARKEMQRGWE